MHTDDWTEELHRRIAETSQIQGSRFYSAPRMSVTDVLNAVKAHVIQEMGHEVTYIECAVEFTIGVHDNGVARRIWTVFFFVDPDTPRDDTSGDSDRPLSYSVDDDTGEVDPS